jgi:hypothetical protein
MSIGPQGGASQTVGGSTLPSNPTPRQVFMKTSGGSEGLYICFSAGTWLLVEANTGAGTVTSVSVSTANGISGVVANPTTTPAITLTLGAITPTTVNGLTISSTTGTFTLTNGKTLSVAKTMSLTAADDTGVYTFPTGTKTLLATDGSGIGLSGVTLSAVVPNTAPASGQILTGNAGGTAYAPVSVSGDATLTNTGALTLASTISAGGPTGSATVAPIITYDAKGRLTAVSSATITPAVGSITGLGTGVSAALAINVGSAGAPVLFNGAGGTPSSMVGTNITGTAASLTAGTASAVAVGGITGLGTSVATALAVNVGSAGAFVVNGGALGTPSSGTATNLSGTAANLTAGLATDAVSKTGTGSTYATGTAPTITNPIITNIAPGADFTITQNSVAVFKSENSGAIVDTLHLKAGKVGIGQSNPTYPLSLQKDGSTLSGTAVLNAQFFNAAAVKGVSLGYDTADQTGIVVGDTASAASNLAFWNYSGAAWLERMRITSTGNVKIAGTAARGTTEGTNHLDIFNGTAPAGTLSNGISLYSSSGECFVMDAGGTATQLSSHDRDTNEWIHHSFTEEKRLIIKMEQLCKFIDAKFGTSFVEEVAYG